MKDFQRTVHIYAERHGCQVQTLDDISAFTWSGPLPKPSLAQLATFETEVVLREDAIKALTAERDRRVDALVGETRSKLLTVAVVVDILVKHALGDDLTMRDRETLAAGRADLAGVSGIYQKAAALRARLQAGETIEDLTHDEHWT